MPALVLPAVCDFSITNVCNAVFDFCGFARDKTLAGAARYVDTDAFSRALPILHRRGVRFITLQGGEPLVHPEVIQLVSQTTEAGISYAIITNGWFLPRYIESLAVAGLSRLIVSIDSANLAEHERNRGLEDWSVAWPGGSPRRALVACRYRPRLPSTVWFVTMNCRIHCGAWGSIVPRSPIPAASRSGPPHWYTEESRSWSISTATSCSLRLTRS